MPKISIEFNANASNSLESILELQNKICEYSKNMTEFHSSRMEKEFDLREISQMFLMNMYGRWQASLGAVLCVGTPELLQEMDEFFKQISNKAIETKKGE